MSRFGRRTTIVVALANVFARAESARLSVETSDKPQSTFAGDARLLRVAFHNAGEETALVNVNAQVFQASSATGIPIGKTTWKSLQVLPGQTVIETPALSFPSVQSESRFLVRWVDDKNRLIGITDVHVYPTNLMAGLRSLGGGLPLGLFDPDDNLKPLLRSTGVPFQDLIQEHDRQFSGKLAIFGPFQGSYNLTASPRSEIVRLAKAGKACVWIQTAGGAVTLHPSIQGVRVGDGMVVVAQHDLVSHFADNPEAQMNLLRLAEFAVYPARLELTLNELQTDPDP